MSKTEAAEMVARVAVRFAEQTGQPVTRLLVQEAANQMLSDCPTGTLGRIAAETHNYKTAYRLACRILRNLGRADLISGGR